MTNLKLFAAASLSLLIVACGGGPSEPAKPAYTCDQSDIRKKTQAATKKIRGLAATDPEKLRQFTADLESLADQFKDDEPNFSEACAAYDALLAEIGVEIKEEDAAN